MLQKLDSLLAELHHREQQLVAATEDQARLAAIVECSEDAIISKGLDGIIRTWNGAAERLFGYEAAEVIGRPITVIIPPDRLDEEKRIISSLKRGSRVDHYETIRVHRDGTPIHVLISASPVRDASGRITGASKVARDLTGVRKAEAALRESEQRMRAIIETAVDAIVTIDDKGIIESANPAIEKMFGYARAELVGQNIKMLMPDPYRGEHDDYLRNYLRTGHARIIGIGREVTALRKDQTTFPMSLSVSEVALGSRRLFTGMIHDLSTRRLLERQIVEASSNEQRRIGQDLHDGLCQDLIGIAFAADIAAKQLRDGAVLEPGAIERIATSVRESALQARRLSHGLNPVDPKAGGLPPALDTLARRISETFHLTCTFEWDRRTRVRDALTATHLYRIAQEAVSNAIKHGKAKEIAIRLLTEEGYLVLTVSDNGIGLPASMFRSSPGTDDGAACESATGIGLHSMKYRAHMIGATFDIRQRAEGGAIVECMIRLPSPGMESVAQEPAMATTPSRRRASVKSRPAKRAPSR